MLDLASYKGCILNFYKKVKKLIFYLSVMKPPVMQEFKPEEFAKELQVVLAEELKQMHEEAKEKAKNEKNVLSSAMLQLFTDLDMKLDDSIPSCTAEYVGYPASIVMSVEYQISRDDGKPHYDALVKAQNSFLYLAYCIAGDAEKQNFSPETVRAVHLITGTHEIAGPILDKLKSGFQNFHAYTNGDEKDYFSLLLDSTYRTLQKIHGPSEIFDKFYEKFLDKKQSA